MKFKEEHPFPTPEAAERKLLELANVVEADHAGRLSVAIINTQFRKAGGSYEEYGAAVRLSTPHTRGIFLYRNSRFRRVCRRTVKQ